MVTSRTSRPTRQSVTRLRTRARTANIEGPPVRLVTETMAPSTRTRPFSTRRRPARSAHSSASPSPGGRSHSRIASVARARCSWPRSRAPASRPAQPRASQDIVRAPRQRDQVLPGMGPDGLDVPLNPPEVTLLAACHLVPERVPRSAPPSTRGSRLRTTRAG